MFIVFFAHNNYLKYENIKKKSLIARWRHKEGHQEKTNMFLWNVPAVPGALIRKIKAA